MSTIHTFRRIAVVNRGEAALRFLRALADYNAERGTTTSSAVFYTDPDAHAPFVRRADVAIPLGPALVPGPDGRLRSAYLDVERIVGLLRANGCDAVWPGWGFVSEDAAFVERLEQAGMTFIGPPSSAMHKLGDKRAAKVLAEQAGVPLAPWDEVTTIDTPADVEAKAARIGFPLMVKASAGGGGRGIRKVSKPEALLEAVSGVRGEVERIFGAGTVLLEACVEGARHVEVQLMVDADGKAHALGVRDCSIQRRHQKVIEETPSSVLPPEAAELIMSSAARMAELAGYRNAGTAEFMWQPQKQQAAFLEVNARLQVEHPITELVTGCDLVHAQIDTARGLPFRRPAVAPGGHAIEVRLCAEDPERDCQPSPGKVRLLRLPAGPGVRVDAGIEEGLAIAPEFDSMVAKVMAWAPTRELAFSRLRRALAEMQVVIEDGAHNGTLLATLLEQPPVIDGSADTQWLDRALPSLKQGGKPVAALLAAAVLRHGERQRQDIEAFFRSAQAGMPRDVPKPEGRNIELRLDGKTHTLEVHDVGLDRFRISLGGPHHEVRFEPVHTHLGRLTIDGHRHDVLVSPAKAGLRVEVAGGLHTLADATGGLVRAPAPGLVVRLEVTEGQVVKPGDRLAILEAMKLEMPLECEVAGRVGAILCRAHQQVTAGQPLFSIETEASESEEPEEAPKPMLAPPPPRPMMHLAKQGQAQPTLVDELPESEAMAIVRDIVDGVRGILLGFDVPGPDGVMLRALIKLELEFHNLSHPERWLPLCDLLEDFVAVESLFVREALPGAQAGAVTVEYAFYDLCRRLALGDAKVEPALAPLLHRALGRYFLTEVTPTEAVREALWRMAIAHAHDDLRFKAASSLVRAVLAMHSAGMALPDMAPVIADVERVAGANYAALAENARQCLLQMAPHRALELEAQRGQPPHTASRMRYTGPWDLVRWLIGDDSRKHHADLAGGRFVEYDLDEAGERLVAVTREPGQHQAGVVVGILSHATRKHPEGMQRVLVASDPARAMGALGEAECKRVCAAFDLAAERGLPIEWVPVSSGARIAMDSGTENLDWTARVLRRIVEFTRDKGVVHVLVAGTCVGAQSYWNAMATMLLHTRGVLVMTPEAAMVLTGKRALEVSGSVAAEDERGIGGFDRVMGPNGEAQFLARDIGEAYGILFEHYRFTYVQPGERGPRRLTTRDPIDRSLAGFAYTQADGFTTVADIFDERTNPGRKKPFAIREVMGAVIDQDGGNLERWAWMRDGETAVVWDAHLGGVPVCVLGFESRPQPRRSPVPLDGPDAWSGGTLFPRSSRKVGRALRAASGNRPVVVLANLSGFDGSPESMRRLQLEHGADIGRAVIEFEGPILFVVVGRYHGGAYVVFSKALNPQLQALALEGSFASVIGGAPAAAVVFPREVRKRAEADPRVQAARKAVDDAPERRRPRLREKLDAVLADVTLEKQAEVAREFDAIHSVERAVRVGSLDAVISPDRLRSELIARLGTSLG